MGVTTPIMDLNLSFIHDYRIGLISAPDILTRDIPANENYVSKDIPALGYYSTGTFLQRYISVQCQNVLVLKLPYCCAWCRNILVLKCTHALMSRDEKSPCQKVPVPKYPCAEKSMWRKIPERKSPLAKMSMETKCLYVHSPICQNVHLTKC